MSRQLRLLFGISVFWLALSALTDGINTLVLPLQVGQLLHQNSQATFLGLLTFVGLLAGALVQPVAGAFSDRLRSRLGRKGFIAIGLVLSLASLFFFMAVQNRVGIMLGYLAIQVSASIAQAGQQALLPDLVSEHRRGLASGLKGFMDLLGAMLGFVLLGRLLASGGAAPAIGALAALLVGAYTLAALLTLEDRPGRHLAGDTQPLPLANIFRFDLASRAAFVRVVASRFLFLLGMYATGRFLLFFVEDRLGLSQSQAVEQAGNLLAGLALLTVLASPLTGWLADRTGRVAVMVAGALFSGLSALLLIGANSAGQILLFGGLMSVGSAAFAGGSWALVSDLVPRDQSGRFFGLANFSTAGAAAAAGLFGPVIDGIDRLWPGQGFSALFVLASLTFLASALPLMGPLLHEKGERHATQGKIRSDAAGLAVLSLPADPAAVEKDPDPAGRPTQL